MLFYNNNSSTAVIVLHEIYGINSHIIAICDKLAKYGFDVIAPNLLNQAKPFDYSEEEAAYNNFKEDIGFDQACSQIKELLNKTKESYKNIYLLGFSAGATIAWLCSESSECDLVIGFYGSRIRDYLTIKPKCPVLLLFPSTEPSFDVDSLLQRLAQIENIEVSKIDGKHGFTDPFSPHYNRAAARKACMAATKFAARYQKL
ncbi:MAG: dienelactone hydrolase family protein [Acidaminococcaceae bacterium]